MTKDLITRNIYLFNHHPELFVAINHHRTHKNKAITFKGYPYLKQIYFDNSRRIVLKKCTQVGITEYLIIKAIVQSAQGKGIFYVLPTYDLVGRFVKNRVDKSIDFTPYYQTLIRGTQSKFTESVKLKHIGNGSIAFVGSNSSAGFTEYPADTIIIDELDECSPDNIPMAEERQSASEDPQNISAANPKIENTGIDVEYEGSDKKEWLIKCSNCGKQIKPDFFDHVVDEVDDNTFIMRDTEYDRDSGRDLQAICHLCNKPFNRRVPGQWLSMNSRSDVSGYHISKMFSTRVNLADLARRFEGGLANDIKLQRFYNGDLGMAFTAKGAKIDVDLLNSIKADYAMPDGSLHATVCGLDIGNDIHAIVARPMPTGELMVIYIGKLKTFEDIKELKRKYRIRAGCIDALPEKRLAKKVVSRLKGFFMVYYSDTAKKEQADLKRKIAVVDRTETLDKVKERIVLRHILLPRNADQIAPLKPNGLSEFYFQMCSSTRVYNEKQDRYNWTKSQDHYFHAMNYMNIAYMMLVNYRKK